MLTAASMQIAHSPAAPLLSAALVVAGRFRSDALPFLESVGDDCCVSAVWALCACTLDCAPTEESCGELGISRGASTSTGTLVLDLGGGGGISGTGIS